MIDQFIPRPVRIGILASLSIAAFCLRAQSAEDPFTHWPAGASPEEVGKRVAENFVARPLGFESDPKRTSVVYPEVCTWYGALNFAELTKDQKLQQQLIAKFDPLLGTNSTKVPSRMHVDDRVFGIVPFEIYRITRERRYLDLGLSLANAQWAKTTPDGITTEARYWIDDMFMITALQVQAFRVTRQASYLDHAALTMTAYLDRLQQTNGLFFHAAGSPFYWSRGNGWVAAGMAELLRSLPRSDPRHARILAGYRNMMSALLRCQGADGLWRQLIDVPEAWPETSGTAMFTFAMISGVRSGWLDASVYGPAARKAWLGLVGHLDAQANIDSVCEGTGKGPDVKYYLDRKRNTGDLHGQAPVLWAADAMLR